MLWSVSTCCCQMWNGLGAGLSGIIVSTVTVKPIATLSLLSCFQTFLVEFSKNYVYMRFFSHGPLAKSLDF